MTTMNQFVDQVSAMLHSYTGVLEATTFLNSATDSSTITIPIAHPSYLTRGLIEVDNELMHINAVGDTSATLMPFGRGAQNTTAVSHLINAKVTNDPMFPRQRIFDAVVRCVLNVQLDLFVVKTAPLFPYVTVQTQYDLPADMVRVLGVQYQVVGPTKEWVNVTHWDIDQNADTSTGKALIIHEPIQAGRNIQVTYAATLPTPTGFTDDLETLGIPTWMHSVLIYGTAWEMIQFLEPARLNLRTVEARTQADGLDPGAASNVAKQLYAMYQLRLDAARKRLLTTHPSPKHYTRY